MASLPSATPELEAERAGHLLSPSCLKLGKETLRAGPHQGHVAFFLTLKRSAIICHYGPRLPLSPPLRAEAEKLLGQRSRVGGLGMQAGEAVYSFTCILIKVTEEPSETVYVRVWRGVHSHL